MVRKEKPVTLPPRPAVMFPSIKKLAFKIPREKKKPECLAVRVGRLWREAISVDPSGSFNGHWTTLLSLNLWLLPGQWCGAKRVSVRKSSRPLLEYESWLKVGKNWDVADWREGRVGQRSRIRAFPTDPLGLQQLSDSSANLTSRNGSSIVMSEDISNERLREKKAQQRPDRNALHVEMNISHAATGWSTSRERAKMGSDAKERLPTLPEIGTSGEKACSPMSSEISDPAAVYKRPPGFNAEKGNANSISSSLSGMVGRGRKKLRLAS